MVKKEQTSEIFFVQVREPTEVRRGILEALRDIVEVLQRFEKFRQMRHSKIEKINHLRVLVRQANKMLLDLRSRLPQTNLRAAAVREAPRVPKSHHKKRKKAKPEAKQEAKKEPTELEKLEAELGAIESKLRSLT